MGSNDPYTGVQLSLAVGGACWLVRLTPQCCSLNGIPLVPLLQFITSCSTWLPHTHTSNGQWQLWLFGELPLDSRSADPHSTAVWCGNLLHSCPQPHTAGLFCSSPDGVFATTTKICTRRHFSQGQPQLLLQSPMSFLHADALLGCHSSGGL